ncbi:MAG: DUF5020 family protein [Bacteroidaceae bacterium]|nr:DUF5020 family protein [Bacteroidaceae bacterium]
MKTTHKLASLLTTIVMLAGIADIKAQNIQLQYDFERQCLTSTAEMFRPDGGGSTYFFVDMDYSPKVSGAYWEISRELNFWQKSKVSWLSVHLEYNGGISTAAGSFNNSWLTGLTYSGHSKDFSKTWSVSAMYKLIPRTVDTAGKSQIHNFQITGVWGINFAKGWCTFSGFIDFWREWRPWQGTEFITVTEPQFWVNLNKIKGWDKVNLSLGGEVELSHNFVEKGFRAMPALGAKWTFN